MLHVPDSLKFRSIRVFQSGHMIFTSLMKSYEITQSPKGLFDLTVISNTDKTTTMGFSPSDAIIMVQEAGE